MFNHRKRLHDPRLTAMPVLLALASSLTACAPHARQVRPVTAEPRWTDLPRPVLPANADRPPTQRAQTAHVPALPIVSPPEPPPAPPPRPTRRPHQSARPDPVPLAMAPVLASPTGSGKPGFVWDASRPTAYDSHLMAGSGCTEAIETTLRAHRVPASCRPEELAGCIGCRAHAPSPSAMQPFAQALRGFANHYDPQGRGLWIRRVHVVSGLTLRGHPVGAMTDWADLYVNLDASLPDSVAQDRYALTLHREMAVMLWRYAGSDAHKAWLNVGTRYRADRNEVLACLQAPTQLQPTSADLADGVLGPCGRVHPEMDVRLFAQAWFGDRTRVHAWAAQYPHIASKLSAFFEVYKAASAAEALSDPSDAAAAHR